MLMPVDDQLKILYIANDLYKKAYIDTFFKFLPNDFMKGFGKISKVNNPP